MKKRVLLVAIYLSLGILICVYVAKLFFPTWVIGVATAPNIVMVGQYIDDNLWANILWSCAISFVVWYLYLCACLKKWHLNWKHILAVLGAISIFTICEHFYPILCLPIDLTLLIVIPTVFNAKMKDVGLIFPIHILNQFLTLQIRGIGIGFEHVNPTVLSILVIDVFIWLTLLYLFQNYKSIKGECNGKIRDTTHGKQVDNASASKGNS